MLWSKVSKLLGRFSVIPESNCLRIVSHQFVLLKWEACSFPYIRSLLVFLNFVFGITELSVQWISRSLNQKADSVSKFTDIDDWQITSEFFGLLEQYWGPHTIDCFANFYNTKIERFFSKFWNPGTAGLDAFFQSWQNENCHLVPPFTLVCETLRHMNRDSAVGTLVIPDWPSSAFWPLLLGHYKKRSSHPPVVKKEPACGSGHDQIYN